MSLTSRLYPLRLRRGLMAGALAAAAAVGTLAVTASPASASTGFNVILMPKINPFLTVQVAVYSGAYAGVSLSTISPYLIDVWSFKPMGPDHTYELVNDSSNQCLTTDNIPGNRVFQYPCVGTANQLWVSNIVPGETTARSYHAVSSGLYLDVPRGMASDGAVLDTWYWNGNDNQFFYSRQFRP